MNPSRSLTIYAAFISLLLAGCQLLSRHESIAEFVDNPEPHRQGETLPEDIWSLDSGKPITPYHKGVQVIGHHDLDRRGGNIISAWVDNCFYVAAFDHTASDTPGVVDWDAPPGPTSGVAVLDVSDPTQPALVKYLQDKGAINAAETMHAVETADKSVLAVSTYGGVPGINGPPQGWLSIYDVSDCANPQLMSEMLLPEPMHTLTVSPNGNRVYGTVIHPFSGDGGLQVVDISNLQKPEYIKRFGITRSDGSEYEFAPHEISISPDETRIYAGVIASRGGDLNKDIKIFPPNAKGLGPDAGGIYIIDNSDLAKNRDNPQLRLLGTSHHGGWHGAVQAEINGKPYLVGAGELGACPGAWPRISLIEDETRPQIVGEFRLAMNHRENCPPLNAEEQATGGVSGRAGTATTHFNDVDSATNTRLGLFPFMHAGLRIADLSDPTAPTEIAYFKPGDACMSHVRYMANSNQVWFACSESGFWVIELDPSLLTVGASR